MESPDIAQKGHQSYLDSIFSNLFSIQVCPALLPIGGGNVLHLYVTRATGIPFRRNYDRNSPGFLSSESVPSRKSSPGRHLGRLTPEKSQGGDGRN
ncbi:hypothetical protein TNCT_482421 [Trichonephila clavata]|uniref:Uncharacterized protein n=1 Tax=Trichonephila clavata TaxID=2740835 RepID=A0A8X6FYR5_TRICU|nr:hypothetical protein TNCT_482421 [Trichonephila clavata]